MPKYLPLQTKLLNQEQLRVLFINDLGFQYGAGMAFLRQIQSFLLMGHEVLAICHTRGSQESSIPFIPPQASGKWLGITELPYLHPRKGISLDCIIDTLVMEAGIRSPDVIILGNLHGAGWSVKLLSALQNLGCLVVAFMHDCYLATGRCAYTGDCHRYLSGCNQDCPTWQDYPSVPPQDIYAEWQLRRELFCGSQGIPLATNSQWTLNFARQALTDLHYADCVYCGLDEQLFRPWDKALVRQVLGIPQDKFVILGGAVNTNDYRKGGHIFREVVKALQEEVHFVAFGVESPDLQGVQTTGFLRDYRKMPLLYNAADLFVGTSIEEAFGQTFCEASACGTPAVAFRIDGIPEIARHNLNARLTEEISAPALLEEIDFFRHNPNKCQEFGRAGRKMVEEEFTLQSQGARWIDYLKRLVTFELNETNNADNICYS